MDGWPKWHKTRLKGYPERDDLYVDLWGGRGEV